MSGMEDDNKTSNEIVSTFSISCPAPIINAFEDYFAEVLEKYQDSISSELKDTYFSKYKQVNAFVSNIRLWVITSG